MSEPSDLDRAAAVWYPVSARAFAAIRDEFSLDASYTFSLATPDGAPELGDDQFADDLGGVAFMLRRLQALRYLVRRGVCDVETVSLATNYLAALCQFLKPLVGDGHRTLPRGRDEDGPLEIVNTFLAASTLFLAAAAERHLETRLSGR